MNTTLHSIVDAFTHRHADLRLHCVSIEIEEMPDRIVLKGEVLEQSQLEELRTEITAAHPGVVVDAAQVRVLRKPNPVFRYVSTNFTSLHKTPSWLTEMFSELFYGTRLEILKERIPAVSRRLHQPILPGGRWQLCTASQRRMQPSAGACMWECRYTWLKFAPVGRGWHRTRKRSRPA